MTATNSIAIFGGTFDPIHNGHIHLLQGILKSNKFSKVIVVPAGNPWQKSPNAPALDRLEMAQLALKDSGVDVSDCEVQRSGSSYAIDTVEALAEIYPSSNFTWIIGSDALASLSTWHHIEQLASRIEFLIVKRPGHSIRESSTPHYIQWKTIEIQALDISATKVRELISTGGDISSLVPASVANYIRTKGLYGAA